MPASRRRQDHPLVTIVCVVLAAVIWWSVQPGGALWSLTVLAAVWTGLLIRASICARNGWWLCVVTWGAFFVAWLVTLSWVSDVSNAGWPALAAYSAVYPAVMAVLMRWLTRDGRWRRPVGLPVSLIAAVLGVSLEYIRAEVLFDAWPFHLSGHALWGTPLSQLASVGGVWACSLAVWSVGGALGGLTAMRSRRRPGLELITPVLVLGAGAVVALMPPSPSNASMHVLVVQTDLPQSNKVGWSPEAYAEDVESFIALTNDGLAQSEGSVDVVVWPETMVPGVGFDESTLDLIDRLGPGADHLSIGQRLVTMAAFDSGVPWLVGAPTWLDVSVEDGYIVAGQRFNSAVLIDPEGPVQRSDKIFLTPFGETMPYVNRWPWLEQKLLDFGAAGMRFDLDVADAPVLVRLDLDGELWRFAVPICFEDAVPSVVRRLCVRDGETDVDVIVNISNDGWFGADDGGRMAHEVAAAFRAVEVGRPLVRVANTGVSGVYLPDGVVPWRSAPRSALTRRVSIPRYEGTTLAAAWGNWLPRVCVVLAVVMLLARACVRGPAHRRSSSGDG